MISPEKEAEIRRLLAEGCYSQRGIGGCVGVSHGTVARIAGGKKCVGRRKKSAAFDVTKPRVRCPTCKGLVYLPCLLCSLAAKVVSPLRQPGRPRS